MNLSQLERIVMVAKSGNITDVAQKLYISQPALSQTISTVEDEIGAPIFDRRAQPLKLTPEGEYFIHAARDILRANESMLQNIRNVRSGARGKSPSDRPFRAAAPFGRISCRPWLRATRTSCSAS